MAIDKESNSFKEFQNEMKQKLNTRLYDKIMDAKKEVAGGMVGEACDKKQHNEEDDQKSGGKEAYQKFLAKKLKAKGYDSIEDIPDDKKDDFFNEVEKEWKSDDEGKGEKK